MTTSQSPSMRIAARCCFTVGTDPGWVRMYAATWSGETSRNPRPRASHHARKLPYRPPVRRPRPRVRDPPREELQIPPPVAGPASTITCGRTISPPCPSRPPAPRPPAPEPPSSFRHHLSPTADSPVDERLEPLVVVPERVGQRVELLQRMLRPAEPHLDPVPFDGDPPRGRLASFASRVSTGSFTRIPSGADAGRDARVCSRRPSLACSSTVAPSAGRPPTEYNGSAQFSKLGVDHLPGKEHRGIVVPAFKR